MPTERDPESINAVPLAYATAGSGGGRSRRIFAATCSVLVAILGLPCFIIGFAYCRDGLTAEFGDSYWNQDSARGAGFIFVGAFCVWMAIRWGCEGFGRARR